MVDRYKQLKYNTKDVLTLLTAIPIVITIAVLIVSQVPA
ncbi:hypothetical protein MNBD_GAMMA17-968 [hydrothermal vent metagenome]|uniref:Uncharacterized protein n=1 Tax=hydrothermal vent metagenome TaxID=652676 RepID=A0A3B1ACI3_9ZZZZ